LLAYNECIVISWHHRRFSWQSSVAKTRNYSGAVDPLVATVFGLEGKNKGNVILAFGSRASFDSGEIDLGNVRRTLEREVQVDLPPHEFERRAQGTISIDKSRKILKDMCSRFTCICWLFR
jgi:hypothetical protein